MSQHDGKGRSEGEKSLSGTAQVSESEELRLRVGLSSQAGPVRELNEDCAAFHLPDDEASRGTRGGIFLVADGMGGHQAGEIASGQAVTCVVQEYLGGDTQEPGEDLLRAIRLANQWVYSLARADRAQEGMGTTLVAAVVRGRKVYVANVGDSRAYLVNRTGITQITQDHSWVEEQLQAGLLTRAQAERHPQRNLITRALGHLPTVAIDLFEGEMLPGDALLLCTDGVCGVLSAQQMASAVRTQPPSSAAAALVAQAGIAGGEDNATALVVEAVPTRTAQLEDQKVTVAMQSRQPGLAWIADWVKSPGLVRLGVRRQRIAVSLASVLFVSCFCSILILLPGVSQSLTGAPVAAPQPAPLQDGRLAGSSPEQVAHYLGYLNMAQMASEHGARLDRSDLANSDLWPANPNVFLVGTARSWRCEDGDCIFVIRMAGVDYTVHYPSSDENVRALSGRPVRVSGSQQGDKRGLIAKFIERGSPWWVWWQPAWQLVYSGDLWDGTVWIYGVVDQNPNGLLDVDQSPPLRRGSQVLVRGQWTRGIHSVVLEKDQVYQLQGGKYSPMSAQQSPVPAPTVTLQPNPVLSGTHREQGRSHHISQADRVLPDD